MISTDADADVDGDRRIAEIAGHKVVRRIIDTNADAYGPIGFSIINVAPLSPKTIETGISVKAMIIKLLIIAFNRVAFVRSEHIVV